MKNCRYNCFRIRIILVFLASLALLPAAKPVFGAGPNTPSAPDAISRIHVTSDSLLSNNREMFFEFSGNVVATQKDTVITSDRLKVFYKKNTPENSGLAEEGESVTKIIATGNVTIKFGGRTAVTDQATYTTDDRILVLIGENSKVSSGDTYFTGKKITLHRDDEKISVERGSKPVEAEIRSNDKGLN